MPNNCVRQAFSVVQLDSGFEAYKDEDNNEDHHGVHIISEECCLFHVSTLIHSFERLRGCIFTLIPPAIVYKTTPTGRRKQAAAVGIPVRDVTTAEPPETNIRKDCQRPEQVLH